MAQDGTVSGGQPSEGWDPGSLAPHNSSTATRHRTLPSSAFELRIGQIAVTARSSLMEAL